jgi:hypothetical protein
VAFLDDFAGSMTGYPLASVAISYNSLRVLSGTSGSVNVNEVWGFKITVTNNGDLNMNNVTLHFYGQNGAGVALASTGPFNTTDRLVSPAIATIPAHGSASTVELYFKAPATKSSGTTPEELVRAHIHGWNADLNYLLNNLSSDTGIPEQALSEQVFP